MTDLFLVRHGQATHNLEDRWVGWSDTPLTTEGHRQAEALARRLESSSFQIAALYVSPLLRAWQTATPIGQALRLPPQADEGLKEIDFGRVGGLTQAGFQETLPDTYALWQDREDLSFQFPGGEQRLAFLQRVARTLDEILPRHRDEGAVIVAHGGTLRAGLAHLCPTTMGDRWAYDLGNASLTHVRVGVEGNMVVVLNDCQHLDARGVPLY